MTLPDQKKKALIAFNKGIEYVQQVYNDDMSLSPSEIQTIRTALSAEEDKWLPISDCPEDGTIVLLAWRNSMKKLYANNDTIPDWEMEVRPYCNAGSGGARSWHRSATHFQHLPAPPRNEGGGDV